MSELGYFAVAVVHVVYLRAPLSDPDTKFGLSVPTFFFKAETQLSNLSSNYILQPPFDGIILLYCIN